MRHFQNTHLNETLYSTANAVNNNNNDSNNDSDNDSNNNSNNDSNNDSNSNNQPSIWLSSRRGRTRCDTESLCWNHPHLMMKLQLLPDCWCYG
jgi:hypothetical protein